MEKNILITGCNGFIGRNLSRHLSALGINVLGIDPFGEAETCVSKFISSPVTKEALKAIDVSLEAIVHFAGTGMVSAAEKNPEAEWKNTVESTQTLLEYIVREQPQAKFFYASSAAVYGNRHSAKIKEDSEPAPISNYGRFKLEAERICQDFYQKQGCYVNIIRFFSIYGNEMRKQLLWDFSNRVFVAKEHGAEKVACFGTGEETRDFLNIVDVCTLFEHLLKQQIPYLVVNGGTGISTSVRTILEILSEEIGFTGELDFDRVVRPADPISLVSEEAKLQEIGFLHRVKVEEGVRAYGRWVKQILEKRS